MERLSPVEEDAPGLFACQAHVVHLLDEMRPRRLKPLPVTVHHLWTDDRHAVSMASAWHRHGIGMPSASHRCVLSMSSASHRCVLSMSSASHRHVISISPVCAQHVISISPVCAKHVISIASATRPHTHTPGRTHRTTREVAASPRIQWPHPSNDPTHPIPLPERARTHQNLPGSDLRTWTPASTPRTRGSAHPSWSGMGSAHPSWSGMGSAYPSWSGMGIGGAGLIMGQGGRGRG